MRIFAICMTAVLTLGIAMLAFAAQPAVPPDGFVMQHTKQPVVFNHSTHSKGECVVCHHEVNGKADFQACATAGCHDVFDRKDKTEKSYYNVMHGKNLAHEGCVSCHAKVAGNDPAKKKELTACKNSACHKGAGADS